VRRRNLYDAKRTRKKIQINKTENICIVVPRNAKSTENNKIIKVSSTTY